MDRKNFYLKIIAIGFIHNFLIAVDHLKQYLAIRDRVDFEVTQPLDPQQISMYLALPPARVLHLGGTMTMQKIEKVIYNNGKILHMQYSWPRQ